MLHVSTHACLSPAHVSVSVSMSMKRNTKILCIIYVCKATQGRDMAASVIQGDYIPLACAGFKEKMASLTKVINTSKP